MTIKNVSYEISNKTNNTTDILIKLEDKSIKKDFYYFIKDQLKNFKIKINSKYSIALNSKCDYSNEVISIQILLSLPDLVNSLNLEQIINHITYQSTIFYERIIKLFNSKNESGQ